MKLHPATLQELIKTNSVRTSDGDRLEVLISDLFKKDTPITTIALACASTIKNFRALGLVDNLGFRRLIKDSKMSLGNTICNTLNHMIEGSSREITISSLPGVYISVKCVKHEGRTFYPSTLVIAGVKKYDTNIFNSMELAKSIVEMIDWEVISDIGNTNN